MRRLFLLMLTALALLPATARADAYAWGGAIDGLEVSVVLAGFRDGAGGGGWTEEAVRRFAQRAPQLLALTGRGARLEETVERDEGLTLVLGARRWTLGIREFEGTDAQWDAVIVAVRALALRRAPTRARPARVYTVELAPSLAIQVEQPPGQMFHEECVPCSASEAVHVLADGRRVVGVFESRAAAARGLAWLRTRGIRGTVRPLD